MVDYRKIHLTYKEWRARIEFRVLFGRILLLVLFVFFYAWSYIGEISKSFQGERRDNWITNGYSRAWDICCYSTCSWNLWSKTLKLMLYGKASRVLVFRETLSRQSFRGIARFLKFDFGFFCFFKSGRSDSIQILFGLLYIEPFLCILPGSR